MSTGSNKRHYFALRKASIGQKMLLGQLGVVCAAFFVTFSHYYAKSVHNKLYTEITHTHSATALAQQIETHVANLKQYQNDFFISKKDSQQTVQALRDAQQSLLTLINNLDQQLNILYAVHNKGKDNALDGENNRTTTTKLITKLKQSLSSNEQLFNSLSNSSRQNNLNLTSYLESHRDTLSNTLKPALSAIKSINDMTLRLETEIKSSRQNKIYHTDAVYWILLFIAFVLCASAASLFSFGVLRRLQSLLGTSTALNNGDLTQNTEYTEWEDQLGTLSKNMSSMTSNFNRIISKTRQAASQVAVAANQVLGGNTELSSRTQEQASSLEQVAASMEEMTGTVDTNADNASRAAEQAENTKDLASSGDEVATKTAEAMALIEASNTSINEVLEQIQDFAFQTNLLALNAAVEAARAGEHGRGFAVVANEVRNLASRSAEAAKAIKTLTADNTKNIIEGSQMVKQSGDMLREIMTASGEVSILINEIAAASQEQSSGIQQVNRAVVEMDNITQQNAALVEEAAAASEAMRAQAQQLEELVAFFKLELKEKTEETNEKENKAAPIPNRPSDNLDAQTKPLSSTLSNPEKNKRITNPAQGKVKLEDDDEWLEF